MAFLQKGNRRQREARRHRSLKHGNGIRSPLFPVSLSQLRKKKATGVRRIIFPHRALSKLSLDLHRRIMGK
jgi:hypothetical protein